MQSPHLLLYLRTPHSICIHHPTASSTTSTSLIDLSTKLSTRPTHRRLTCSPPSTLPSASLVSKPICFVLFELSDLAVLHSRERYLPQSIRPKQSRKKNKEICLKDTRCFICGVDAKCAPPPGGLSIRPSEWCQRQCSGSDAPREFTSLLEDLQPMLSRLPSVIACTDKQQHRQVSSHVGHHSQHHDDACDPFVSELSGSDSVCSHCHLLSSTQTSLSITTFFHLIHASRVHSAQRRCWCQRLLTRITHGEADASDLLLLTQSRHIT